MLNKRKSTGNLAIFVYLCALFSGNSNFNLFIISKQWQLELLE